jgi:hypothetical protein
MAAFPAPAPRPERRSASTRRSAGGPAAAVVDGLFGRLLADPALGPFFPRGVGAVHRQYVITIVGEALGSR